MDVSMIGRGTESRRQPRECRSIPPAMSRIAATTVPRTESPSSLQQPAREIYPQPVAHQEHQDRNRHGECDGFAYGEREPFLGSFILRSQWLYVRRVFD